MKKAIVILVGFTALIFFAAVFVRAQDKPTDSVAKTEIVTFSSTDTSLNSVEGKAGLVRKQVQDVSSIKLINVLRGLLVYTYT